jgi:16S rRNA (cytosine1402-N4)-methyltransferase
VTVEFDHQPVLIEEVLDGLALARDGSYVDATYGRGGHSTEILTRLGEDARLLVIDKDPQAIDAASRSHGTDPRVTIRHGDFRDLTTLVSTWLHGRPLNGILLDLGVSSAQLDQPERGFSFMQEGPLDMRMNPSNGPSAAQWLATVRQAQLADVIARYGEQAGAHRIAAAIVRARQAEPIETTTQLANIIARAAPQSAKKIHPATKVFQALRIAVNDELGALESVLSQCVDLLAGGGRLLVISFHSLEDRIVKRFIARQSRGDPAYAGLPDMPSDARPRLRPIGRLVRPTQREIERNPRSRSSRLRVAERLAVQAGE